MTLDAATLNLRILRGGPLLDLPDIQRLLVGAVPDVTADESPLNTTLHLSLNAARAQHLGLEPARVSEAVIQALESDWPVPTELPQPAQVSMESDLNLQATLISGHQVAAALLCVAIMNATERARLEVLAARSGAGPWISQMSIFLQTTGQCDLTPILSTPGAQTYLSMNLNPLPWALIHDPELYAAWRQEGKRTTGTHPQISGVLTRLSVADQPPSPDESREELLLRLITELNATPLPPRGEVRWEDIPLHPKGGQWTDDLGTHSYRDRQGQTDLTMDFKTNPDQPGDHPADFCAINSHLNMPDHASLLALGEELGTLLIKMHLICSMNDTLITRRLNVPLERAQGWGTMIDTVMPEINHEEAELFGRIHMPFLTHLGVQP